MELNTRGRVTQHIATVLQRRGRGGGGGRGRKRKEERGKGEGREGRERKEERGKRGKRGGEGEERREGKEEGGEEEERREEGEAKRRGGGDREGGKRRTDGEKSTRRERVKWEGTCLKTTLKFRPGYHDTLVRIYSCMSTVLYCTVLTAESSRICAFICSSSLNPTQGGTAVSTQVSHTLL